MLQLNSIRSTRSLYNLDNTGMIDLKQFSSAIQQIAEEKGIPEAKVIETIEMALAAAYKKDYGKKGQIIRAAFNATTGDVIMRQIKIVVDQSMLKSDAEIEAEEKERADRMTEAGRALGDAGRGERRILHDDDDAEIPGAERKVRYNPEKHLMADEAKEFKKDAAPGDEIEFPLEFKEDFGRIAAQTAKQVIIQRIREAEREAVYNEYKDHAGELISGLVQRIEGRNIFIDIGRTTALLPAEEQVMIDRYHLGERIKVLIISVEKNPKGPGIIVSRSHPRLVKKLFEIEVPEIASGSVEIKMIAREAGSRSKVAVSSNQDGIDPVGSMVGQKGVRVSTVIHELNGEKIDIIEWAEDPAAFISHALSPAKVIEVQTQVETREARAIVPDDQLSLAIGKGGQNVRLAAKLTGWKIDVRSDKPDTGNGEKAIGNKDEPVVSGTVDSAVVNSMEPDETKELGIMKQESNGTETKPDEPAVKKKPRKPRAKKAKTE
ncbi:MAG: transcription termination/antitermination protein NusA [Candidatus Sungbacteria bacterium]|uniref:Transcription termination/antitermination protein NusA n=1 Tax=Candidatus Sungiibacteriota bacterium TaxID=2750080 RepID=A0A9D6LT31_9BACT|nr:transcription termination/antitermination protein NusA [Candidatus Sungbacteria bacterium]